eukprot:m.285110 g.285110  ORF g.285110 m.285110 type:complete len:601 (+) comp11299_c0_seq1:994-2796(+)
MRAMAWRSLAGFQSMSKSTRRDAPTIASLLLRTPECPRHPAAMAMDEYLLVEPNAPERHRAASKSAKTKIAVILGVVAFVAVTVAVVTVQTNKMHSGSSEAETSASTSGSKQAERPAFNNLHPILSSMPAPTLNSKTVDGVELKYCSYAYSFTDSLKRTTLLNYTVEHVANFAALESLTNVTGVSYNKTTGAVAVTMANAEAAANHPFSEGTYFSKLYAWDQTPDSMLRVASPPEIELTIIYFKAEPAKLSDVIRHADVTFSSNHPSARAMFAHQEKYNDRGIDMRTAPPTETYPSPYFRRDLTSWLQSEWPTIKQWAGYIYEGAELAIDGDLNIDDAQPYAGNWNWGPSNCGFTLPDTTSSCSANLDATVHFSISINDYNVDSISLTVDGNTQLSASGNFDVSEPFTKQGQKQVWSDQLWSGVITVGSVPIPISVSGQLFAGYDLSASASLSVNAQMNVAGSATFGLNYANGQVNWVHNYNLNPTHSISGNAEETATLTLNTMPVLLLKAAYIGGPTVQVSMSGTATLTATQNGEVNDDWDVSGCNHVSASINDQVQVALGGELDIEIDGSNVLNKDWDFVPFPATTYPLANECIGNNN